jgi:hypothetical protein
MKNNLIYAETLHVLMVCEFIIIFFFKEKETVPFTIEKMLPLSVHM